MKKTTILLFHFSEPTGVLPSDSAGNLDDLHAEPGINVPTVVGTMFTGRGRNFARASSQALLSGDLDGRDTLLQRDVTIQALLSLTLTGAAGPHTLIARGLNDGSISERYCYGIEFEEQGSPGNVEVRFFWQDSAGTNKTQPAGVFKHLGDGKEFLLTATRRWESTSKVVCRYYIDDRMIAELTTTDGDISGGTTGHVTVGGRKESGTWDRFLNGTIDELFVDESEMSLEEVRQIWRRLTEHQPAGVETFKGLVPPGLGWARDLGNNIGRRVKVAGQALGLARATAEEMRALWLPFGAPVSQIEKWESLCGVAPKPGDSLDVRRTRVISYMSREEGFSHPAVRAALQGILDLTNPDDLAILEYTNIVTDNFTTLDTDTKWLLAPLGTWSIVANALHLNVPGATDLQWTNVGEQCHARMPLDTGGGRIYVAASITGYSATPTSSGVGVFLHNRVTNHTLWVGIFNDAGTRKLGWTSRDGFTESAFNVLVTPAAAQYWLRIESVPNTPGSYTISWSTSGPNSGFTSQVVATGAIALNWAGFGAWTTIASPASAIAADFDEFLVYTPDGDRAFHWYAYRDPLLAGAPDVEGGHLTVQKVKPAHVFGAVTQSKRVLCDDPVHGLCDHGPLGDW